MTPRFRFLALFALFLALLLPGTSPGQSIAVQEPAGTALTSGAAVPFGTVYFGNPATLTFTIVNNGASELDLSSFMIGGANSADFAFTSPLAASLGAGASTTFTVTFSPSIAGPETASFSIGSNATAGENPFTFSLTGVGADTYSPTLATAATIPFTASGFTASGLTLGTITLGFAPTPGTNLTLIRNVGTSFIAGEINGLANGATINLSYGGNVYPFVVWYYGGLYGRDLVLLWRSTGIAMWGDNSQGELGDGTTTQRDAPVAVDQTGALLGKTVVQVARGEYHTLALTSDGEVYAWGLNANGQLGNNTMANSLTPVAVNTVAGTSALAGKFVVGIAAGDYHSLAVCSDGTVAAWGLNAYGQLGDATTTQRPAPVAVITADGYSALFGKSVVSVAAAYLHSLALCSDGTVVGWGFNNYYELGDNTNANTSTPVATNTTEGVSALFGKSVISIAAGADHGVALCSDGTVAAWGDNYVGRVGDGTQIDRLAPVLVDTAPGASALAGKSVVAIAVGGDSTLALCSDGTIAAWGNAPNSGLGNGVGGGSDIPVAVSAAPGLSALFNKQVAAVGLGLSNFYGLCSDGTLVAWGDNEHGAIGDNSGDVQPYPVLVNTSYGISVLAGATVNSVAIGAAGLGGAVIFGAPPPAELTYSVTSPTYTKGAPIAPNAPSNNGGAIGSYSVSPALPSGLTLDTVTGMITGTPAAVTPAANYTVTGTNPAGSTSVGLVITVNDVALSGLMYSANPVTYTRAIPIAVNTPSSSGGPVVSYSVLPALPPGLTLDPLLGVITGTPTGVAAMQTYTVTATNTGGQTTASVTITVVDPTPGAINQNISTPRSMPVNITLTGSALDSPLSYAVLSSPAHGTLSGAAPNLTYTPTSSYLGADSFTFNVSDNFGGTSPAATVSITLTEMAPVAAALSVTAPYLTPTPITLAGQGGAPLTFSLVTQPSLGTLTGTPPFVTYTADNGGFSATDTFTFTVFDGMEYSQAATVTITITPEPQAISFPPIGTHSVGDAVALSAASSSTLPVQYSLVSGPQDAKGNVFGNLVGSTLTVTGAGEFTVRADCTGNDRYQPTSPVYQTFRVIATTAGFTGLGELAGGAPSSAAYGVSDGGIVVTGQANDGFMDAFVWTAANGMTPLQVGSTTTPGVGRAVSGDGGTIVGVGAQGGVYAPFFQPLADGIITSNGATFLPPLGGLAAGSAQAVSGNGSVVAGYSSSNPAAGPGVSGDQAFVWTAANGLQAIPPLTGGSFNRADGVSADGSTVVGTSQAAGEGNSTTTLAFVWTAAGPVGLPALPYAGSVSSAAAVAANGSTVTVVGQSTGATHPQACVWSNFSVSGEIPEPMPLPELPGTVTSSAATGISADGAIIVGYNTVSSGTTTQQVAVVWQSSGVNYVVQRVVDALTTQYSLDSTSAPILASWVMNGALNVATAISPDGYAIAGNGIDPSGYQEGWLAIIPRPSTVSIASPGAISESAISRGTNTVTLTVTKSTGAATDVSYEVMAGTAVQFLNGVGDYDATMATDSNPSTTVTGAIHFDTYDTTQTITIPLNYNPSPITGGVRTFKVDLSAATDGALISSTAGTATVTLDANTTDPNGPATGIRAAPSAPPTQTGEIYLTQPSVPSLGWRFAGESAWRPYGTDGTGTASGLLAGQYLVEFEGDGNGGPAPQPQIVTVDPTQPQPQVVTLVLASTSNQLPGSLFVQFSFQGSAGGSDILQQAGGWRLVGTTVWQPSTATLTGLAPGFYIIEFEPAVGFVTPPTQNVSVQPNLTTTVLALYELPATLTGTPPSVLTLSQATTQSPYEFVGQLSTDVATGSGVAVEPRVVLSAAHVVFDDAALTFATGLSWQFERMVNQFEPTPIIPLGSYVLSGYAASRTTANQSVTPNEGTLQTEEDDLAAIYFDTPVARGGASSYLQSTAGDAPLEWLLKDREAILVGYPVDLAQVSASMVGDMFATPAIPVTFAHADPNYGVSGFTGTTYPDVYATTDIAGLAGMSGGPVFVQYDDGTFYPAGVYLGGNSRSIVRSIDAQAVSLIQAAVLSSNDDLNHSGGGVIVVSTESAASTAFPLGFLTVGAFPAEAAAAAGSCDIKAPGVSTTLAFNASSALPLTPDVYTISFPNIKDYMAPPTQIIDLQAGQTITVNATYLPFQKPVIMTSSLPLGGAGLAYPPTTVAVTNGPTTMTVSFTNKDGTPPTTSLGLGFAFNSKTKTGVISGTVNSDVETGSYMAVVNASNQAGAAETRKLPLQINAASSLMVTYVAQEGTVSGAPPEGVMMSLPEGEPIDLIAKPKSGYLFDGWTAGASAGLAGSGVAEVSDLPYYNPELAFSLGQPATLMASFIPNPFLTVSGEYNGLLTGSSPNLGNRGFATISLTPLGAFTASIKIGAASYAVSGNVDVQGAYNGVVGHGVDAMGLSLRLDVTNRLFTGTASVNGTSLVLSASRATFTAKKKAPQALGGASANYVIALPHVATTGAPMGDGFGTATVSSNGAVTFAGTLGDGTAITERANLGPDGEWPFFVLLYQDAGVITGPLTISAQGVVKGNLDWYKPADVVAPFYPGGFVLTANPVASEPANPIVVQGLGFVPGTNLLNGLVNENLTSAFTGGGLSSIVPIEFSIGANGSGVAPGSPGFSLNISGKTGLFSGKFLNGRASYPFSGVIIPPGNGIASAQGFGLFKGAPSTGKVNSPPGVTGSVEF